MTSGNIFLLLISGLGVLHGLILSMVLFFYSKGNHQSNRLLSFILLVLSLRVGKSVFLEFAASLDVKIVFSGLALIMAIGPLFYLYTKSFTGYRIKFGYKHLIHFVPACIGIVFGIWLNEGDLEELPIGLFVFVFLSYYCHYLIYLTLSYLHIRKVRDFQKKDLPYQFWFLLFYALIIIWLAYVLNLFDEFIPYVVGPILYTIVAYSVTFLIIRKGYPESGSSPKYKTNPVSDEQVDQIFSKLKTKMESEKIYLDHNLTMKGLSQDMNLSPQVVSLVINKKSGSNFNHFLNSFRINESIRLFSSPDYVHQTIASIAYDVGFNSLSSFNSAFKKHTGKTPRHYRDELTK